MELAQLDPEFSRYHAARIQFMGSGRSPTCGTIVSLAPTVVANRLVFPFEVDGNVHRLNVDFPGTIDLDVPSRAYYLGVAMSEAYRLAEIITPTDIHFPWYPCPWWERAWWQEDIAWYLQQKLFLEKWAWNRMPRINFPISNAADNAVVKEARQIKSGYLLAVSGGKESTFAWEWLRRARLRHEAFTLHHSGGYLGNQWESKFPVFDSIRSECTLHELRQYPDTDPAVRFGYQGVRNDPTITNALFLMMVVAEARGFKYLALANDRSSNEGNTVHEGREVNHQSAKGSAYIKRFNEYCAAKGLVFRYVSLCEEAYSLGAVNYLAKWNVDLLRRLASCNEAQWSRSSDRWCRACPKCAFSYALIEAAGGRELAIGTVGEDLILKPELLATWRALFDPALDKPFECVGEKRETAAALGKLKRDRAEAGFPLGWLKDLPETSDYNDFTPVLAPSGIPEADKQALAQAITAP